jgi:hypothetical protein
VSGCFWPIAEPAQADYERLRAAVLGGDAIDELLAARFARRGLAGLIEWPRSQATYLSSLVGASRPAWSGREDPREARLAEAYRFLLSPPASGAALRAVAR